MFSNKQKGFTLIELLIVIAIIGLLAALALVSLTAAQQRSRDTKRVADMKSMQTAFELLFNETAAYIQLGDGSSIGTGSNAAWTDVADAMTEYISSLPVDPTNSGAYVYTYWTDNDNSYFLRAALEDDEHIVLSQDFDDSQGDATWVSVNSGAGDTVAAVAATGISCDDNVGDSNDENNFYCLAGTASQ